VSGHSKWANIRRKKAVVDAERGRVFSRLVREITSASRTGGANPDANMRLKAAVEKARAQNLPADTIQRAIQRGQRAAAGEGFENFVCEGYGPGGVAFLLEMSSDNRNRTAAEIRHLLSRHGGTLGESGSVAWMFGRQGEVRLAQDDPDEERLLEAALEAGADDLRRDDDGPYLVCDPERLVEVADGLRHAGWEVAEASVVRVPHARVAVPAAEAERCLELLEMLEEHEDVEAVYSNLDVGEADGAG
jgi:YebC/PmpR family DNA-binding regulatory protein